VIGRTRAASLARAVRLVERLAAVQYLTPFKIILYALADELARLPEMTTRSITEVDRIFPETRYRIEQALRAAIENIAIILNRDPRSVLECETITAQLNDIARWLGLQL
jgi:hypothetical protein